MDFCPLLFHGQHEMGNGMRTLAMALVMPVYQRLVLVYTSFQLFTDW